MLDNIVRIENSLSGQKGIRFKIRLWMFLLILQMQCFCQFASIFHRLETCISLVGSATQGERVELRNLINIETLKMRNEELNIIVKSN